MVGLFVDGRLRLGLKARRARFLWLGRRKHRGEPSWGGERVNVGYGRDRRGRDARIIHPDSIEIQSTS